jgi:hypothetical protein
MNLAVVLVTICVVFLVCHLLRVYLAIQVSQGSIASAFNAKFLHEQIPKAEKYT